MKNGSSIFEIHDLVMTIDGKQILNIPQLSFERGNVYCLYGKNGSGKTTLFEVLTLLQKPTGGRLVYDGREIYPCADGLEQLRSRVTLVHQNPLLFDTTVEKNVDYGLRIRHMGRAERKKQVAACLDVVGLDGFQKRKAKTLSGGEAQRVAIARALSINPEVLFLDEFSANVDTDNRIILENIIKEINKRYNTTILFTTHYVDQAYRVADTVVQLVKGKPVAANMKNLFSGTMQKTDHGTVFTNSRISFFVNSPAEGEAHIAVPQNAVILSKAPLESSMRNCLKGTVTHIIDNGKHVILRVSAGEVFEVEITKESFHEMSLGPGQEAYLNFKASAVEVF